MAYAADRRSTVKLDASPSMLFNNLTTSTSMCAFAHKDAVYLLDLRAVDSRAPATLEKLPLKDPLSGVTQASPPPAVCRVLDERGHLAAYESPREHEHCGQCVPPPSFACRSRGWSSEGASCLLCPHAAGYLCGEQTCCAWQTSTSRRWG